jgi:hypothetical protein
MWTDTDVEYILGLVGDRVSEDFGLDSDDVSMSIQQTLNDLMQLQERAKKAAQKRCNFEVIQGGLND